MLGFGVMEWKVDHIYQDLDYKIKNRSRSRIKHVNALYRSVGELIGKESF